MILTFAKAKAKLPYGSSQGMALHLQSVNSEAHLTYGVVGILDDRNKISE